MIVTYCYVGTGLGVPGVPSPVTRAQAIALGVEDVLDAAIDLGNFEECEPEAVLPAEMREDEQEDEE